MTSLSQIVRVEPDLLYKTFSLEPWYRYDTQQEENVAFISPIVLLDDREIRDGGLKDRGPKEVLSRLSTDILNSKTHSLFQVPEITYMHMGYGKMSENKKHSMAITENEAKFWLKFLDLSSRKKPGEVLYVHEGEEEPMEVAAAITFPEQEDTQAYEFEKGDAEDLVDPNKSGLKRWVKGSYLLLFSILLIFFEKKESSSPAELKHKGEKIGANKISDFLAFWILPYLLNFTHRKVKDINAHHKRKYDEESAPEFTVPTVEKSAMDIIQDALHSCQVSTELEKIITDKYRQYYGTQALKRKYNLPATRAHTPIILVPLQYKVTDMPVAIEDLGTRWREIGDVHLVDEFISKFIESEPIQTDFLHSFGYLKDLNRTDYAVLLPDLQTFSELIGDIEEEHPDIFQHISVPKQGRNLVAPRRGVVKHTEKNLSVCFSYFQGCGGSDVATLFRVIGSHRLNHFTLVILNGSRINPKDSKCELLSLYPVSSCRKFSFKGEQLQRRIWDQECDHSFKEGVGKFCSLEFPETFKSWEQEIHCDPVIVKAISRSDGKLKYPTYESQPLLVAYSKAADLSKLKNTVVGATVAQTPQKLENLNLRAVNLDGCLLSRIARNTHPKAAGVVLAINDTLGPLGCCLPSVQNVMKRVIANFVRAVVVAGLPSVYPPKPGEEDGDDVHEDSGSSDDDDSDDEQPASSAENEIATSDLRSEASPRVKPGIPEDDELHGLANDVSRFWKKVGRELKVEEWKLDQLDVDQQDVYEKAYQMLWHWRQTRDDQATYQILYSALTSTVVGRSDLGRKYCELT